MKRSIFFLLFVLLLAVTMLCSCETPSEDPNGDKPTTVTDPDFLEVADTIAQYKIVYCDDSDFSETAAKIIAKGLSDAGVKNIPVISESDMTDEDVYIITVGDVDTGKDYGDDLVRDVDRQGNAAYGAFCASFGGKHIYVYADADNSLMAAAEYFSNTYLKKGQKYLTIPSPDETEVLYFSKDDYSQGNIKSAMVTKEDLMKLADVLSVSTKTAGTCIRMESSREGFTIVLNKGDAVPDLVCETTSPFAKYKVGKYSSSTGKVMITVTSGDRKTEENVYVNVKFINPTYLFTISDDAVTEAMSTNLAHFREVGKQTEEVLKGANALLTLALYENAYPGQKSGVADRVREHLRNTLRSGNEPCLDVGPFWANPNYACAVALAKQTPTVWNKLSDADVEKLDWIMRGYAVITNYSSNSQNDFLTGPEMLGNFSKGWNPNFQSSNLLPIIACVSYFGSAEKVNSILTGFSYDEYIAKYTKLGFYKIVKAWTMADKYNGDGFVKRLMEEGMGTSTAPFTYKRGDNGESGGSGGYGVGVKVEFTYGASKIPLADTDKIYNAQILALYSEKVVVSCGEATLQGDVLNLPNKGEIGMMKEYNAVDSSGIRSSSAYCTHNFGIMVPAAAAFIALDLWDPEDVNNQKYFSQIYVGNEDHIYRLTVGYNSVANGHKELHTENNMGFVYTNAKSIWRDYLVNFIHK